MSNIDKKVRVLHIIGNLRFGGAQVVVKQIVENSDPDHFEHYVYSLRPEPIELTINGEIIKHHRIRYDLRKFSDLARTCKKKNIDIVHTHLYKSVLGGLLLTFFCPVKIIVHEHGPIFDAGISSLIYGFWLRFLHSRSAKIIANSRTTALWLQKRSKIQSDRIHIIPNAADLARFQHNGATRTRLRKEYGLSDEAIVIGFIGRLHPTKGISALVQAMRILVKQNSLFHLFIVGDGPLKKSLNRKVHQLFLENHIRFLGYREDVSEIMNIFDISCMPSQCEPFGIAAIEIMSMKIPLVCSCAGGLGEITEDRKTALHIREITPEAIAESILELSRDNSLRQKIAMNAFKSSQQYSIENFVHNIETLYTQIVKPEKESS